MNKQIIHVAPLQSAKVMAVLYLILSIPFVALIWRIPNPMTGARPSLPILVDVPLGYMLGGFLFTLIGAWIYNLVAVGVGGFEYTTIDVTADD